MPSLREESIRGYFEGTVTPTALDAEAAASLRREPSGNARIVRHEIVAMADDFTVTVPHLVRLIDDVTGGRISLDAVDAIAFCLEASSQFTWSDDPPDADRIPDALFWLGPPEVNAPLTHAFLERARRYLLTGKSPFGPGPQGQ